MPPSPSPETPPGSSAPNGQASLPESARTLRRRNLLRLVAGGVPLLSASPVSARLAASSAWRGARNDATLNPPMVSNKQDGWIRARIEIVEIRITAPGSKPKDKQDSSKGPGKPWEGGGGGSGGPGKPEAGIQAYKFGDPPRYYQISGLMPINSLYCEEIRKVGHVYSLVLFDKSGGIHGVDPGKMLGNGLQGLHYSSWRSISPTGQSFPGYGAGV